MGFYKKSQEAGLGRDTVLGIIILLIVLLVISIFIWESRVEIIAKLDSFSFFG